MAERHAAGCGLGHRSPQLVREPHAWEHAEWFRCSMIEKRAHELTRRGRSGQAPRR
jgi:hypothetical protein